VFVPSKLGFEQAPGFVSVQGAMVACG